MVLEKIILVDDNSADNLFHKIIIEKAGFTGEVLVFQYGEAALAYLLESEESEIEKRTLILLDIYMPRMNGLEFLAAYSNLQAAKQVHAIVLMLTTQLNPGDEAYAKAHPNVKSFLNKPLTVESFQKIVTAYFA